MTPTRIAALACAATLLLARTVLAEGGVLRIQVSGFRNAAGELACALYSDARGFPGAEGAVATAKAAVTLPLSECIFRDVRPGRYAVTVLHDENRNGRMDRVPWIGIPLEGYGVTNNRTYATHAPVFEESAITFAGQSDLILHIALRY
jgi:uncharacterized protein (DUF2141 family)